MRGCRGSWGSCCTSYKSFDKLPTCQHHNACRDSLFKPAGVQVVVRQPTLVLKPLAAQANAGREGVKFVHRVGDHVGALVPAESAGGDARHQWVYVDAHEGSLTVA